MMAALDPKVFEVYNLIQSLKPEILLEQLSQPGVLSSMLIFLSEFELPEVVSCNHCLLSSWPSNGTVICSFCQKPRCGFCLHQLGYFCMWDI